jgi:fatty-acyl-CoA synthase
MDAEGFLYISGRAKDLIIRSGHNIDPELIEEPLNAHAGVVTSIAIGLPDPYAGELPMAYVVKVAGSDVTKQELLDHCASAMSERAAYPKRIEFIDTMPLTAVGKIFRPTLRQKISEQVIRELLAEKSLGVTVTSEMEKKRGLVLSIDVIDKAKIDEVKKLVEGYIFTSEVN